MEKMIVTLCGAWGNGEDYEIVNIELSEYTYSGNLAIQLYSKDPEYGFTEPFATLTVNLEALNNKNLAYIDTNNCPWATSFIEKYKLGKPTGKLCKSDYCEYPLYEMDIQELSKYQH